MMLAWKHRIAVCKGGMATACDIFEAMVSCSDETSKRDKAGMPNIGLCKCLILCGCDTRTLQFAFRQSPLTLRSWAAKHILFLAPAFAPAVCSGP